jgi:Ran GTPase-activating protein (RanGAP) involved in mRNA processing and transport
MVATLAVLDLSGNNFGDEVVHEFATILAKNGSSGHGKSCALQCLKLDSNQLRGHCIPAVANLVETSGLRYLSLNDNPQLNSAVRPLLEVLVGSPVLTGLDLTNTGLEVSTKP